jgi:hypothetical protein
MKQWKQCTLEVVGEIIYSRTEGATSKKMHGKKSNVLAQGMEARLRVAFHLTYTTPCAVCLTTPEYTTFYVTAWDWMGHHGITWNFRTYKIVYCGAITHCLQGST